MPGISIVPAPEFPSPLHPDLSSMRVILIPFSCIISPSMRMVSNHVSPFFRCGTIHMHFPATDPQCGLRPIALTNFRTERDVAQSLTQKSPGTPMPSLPASSECRRPHAFYPQQKLESEFGLGVGVCHGKVTKLQCIAMFMPNKVQEYFLSNRAVKEQ